jgi:hypothetical protein
MNQVVNQKQNMNHRQPKYTSFGYKLSTITVTLLSTITILTALFENLVMTLPFVFTRMVSKLGVYNPTLLRNTHTDTHTHTHTSLAVCSLTRKGLGAKIEVKSRIYFGPLLHF